MRLALVALALAVAGCDHPMRGPDLPPGGGWRRNFLELDQGLEHVFAACGLSQLRHMNLGDAENDGRGDSVQLALSTAAVNLNYLANSGCLKKQLSACATHFCSPEETARDHSGNGVVYRNDVTGTEQCCDLIFGCAQPKPCVYEVPHGKSFHGIPTTVLPQSHQ